MQISVPQATAQGTDSIYYRGSNYETWTYANGTVKWSSTHQAVFNGTHWIDYLFSINASAKYYQIQVGLVASRLYRGRVEFYKPDMSVKEVGRENWLVFKWSDAENKWNPVCASLEAYWLNSSIVEAVDYVDVTSYWHTAAGTLKIKYHFVVGGGCKHNVEWLASNAGKYVVVQFWEDIIYEKCKLENMTVLHRNDNHIIGKADGLKFLFYNDTQPFGVFENQASAQEWLVKSVFCKGSVMYQGINVTDACAWIFGVWNLTSGETLTVDPTTSTFISSSSDGYLENCGTNYTTVHDADSGTIIADVMVIDIFQERDDMDWYFIKRGFVFFDTSNIPNEATITSAHLQFTTWAVHGTNFDGNLTIQNGQPIYPHYPLEQTDYTHTQYSGNGGTVPVNFGNDEAFNIVMTTDGLTWINKAGTTKLCLRLSEDIYATQPPSEQYHQVHVWSREAEVETYRPKLIVEYESLTAPTIGNFQAPTIAYANKYFFLNATINDGDGVSDFVNATVELSNSVILKWNASTNTFLILSDPNGYCTLDASNSMRTQMNATAYKLSWKIMFPWNHTEGYVSITVTNTKVFDSGDTPGSGSKTNLFTFEDDLIMYSATVNPTSCYPKANVTFSGIIHYNGTTTCPDDPSGITVKVELNGTLKGSTTTIDTNGTWNVDVTAPETVTSYAYNVYAETDEITVTNQTAQLTVMSPPSEGGFHGSLPSPPAYRPENYTWIPPILPEELVPTGLEGWGLTILIVAVVGTTVVGVGASVVKPSRPSLASKMHRPKSKNKKRR